jgi:hypothetical protein
MARELGRLSRGSRNEFAVQNARFKNLIMALSHGLSFKFPDADGVSASIAKH